MRLAGIVAAAVLTLGAFGCWESDKDEAAPKEPVASPTEAEEEEGDAPVETEEDDEAEDEG